MKTLMEKSRKARVLVGLPPMKWSSTMFRKTEESHGQQATQARGNCHEVTTG